MNAYASSDGQPSGFTQVPNAILKNNHLSLGARMLYSILLSYCWHKHSCFPSYETLMSDMACGSQALSLYIKELIQYGLIAVVRRGQGKTNLYQLTAVVQPAPATSDVAPAPEPSPAGAEQSADNLSSLKIKEQEFWKSKREEYTSDKYEEMYLSNNRIGEKENDYVNCHNAEQESKDGIKAEGSHGGAVQASNVATHRNLETIETRKITPAPAKPKNTHSGHVPHTARTSAEESTIQTAIQGYIRDAAIKLHDEAPLKSSTTRAYNLYIRSGIQLNTFFDTLYDAEQETQRRSATIRKQTAQGFKNRMAYFFAVLEDRLGLRRTSQGWSR